jgi:hypothetical protein
VAGALQRARALRPRTSCGAYYCAYFDRVPALIGPLWRSLRPNRWTQRAPTQACTWLSASTVEQSEISLLTALLWPAFSRGCPHSSTTGTLIGMKRLVEIASCGSADAQRVSQAGGLQLLVATLASFPTAADVAVECLQLVRICMGFGSAGRSFDMSTLIKPVHVALRTHASSALVQVRTGLI